MDANSSCGKSGLELAPALSQSPRSKFQPKDLSVLMKTFIGAVQPSAAAPQLLLIRRISPIAQVILLDRRHVSGLRVLLAHLVHLRSSASRRATASGRARRAAGGTAADRARSASGTTATGTIAARRTAAAARTSPSASHDGRAAAARRRCARRAGSAGARTGDRAATRRATRCSRCVAPAACEPSNHSETSESERSRKVAHGISQC